MAKNNNTIILYAQEYDSLEDVKGDIPEVKYAKEEFKRVGDICLKRLVLRGLFRKTMENISEDKPTITLSVSKERQESKNKVPPLLDGDKLNGYIGALSGDVTVTRNSLFYEVKKYVYKEKSRLTEKSQTKVLTEEETEALKEYEEIQKLIDDNDNENCLFKSKSKLEYNVNLQIRSRFDKENTAYFTIAMLSLGACDLCLNDQFVSSNMDTVFDLLLAGILADKLKEALTIGYYRKYQTFHANNERVRGSINISRHIRLNMGLDNGRIAYDYRENTINNSFNALVLFAYKHLYKKYPQVVTNRILSDSNLAEFIRTLESEIDLNGYSAKQLISQNLNPIAHPYYYKYEEVRKVCIKILRDEGYSLFKTSEKSDSVQGFLYYAPDAFENLLETFIDDINMSPISFHTQHHVNYLQGNVYLCLAKPDYVFELDTKSLVLDAKYRPQWKNSHMFLDPDLHGDVDKCMRDMVVLQAGGTGVIYPHEITEETKKTILAELAVGESETLENLYSNNEFARRISEINSSNFYIVPFYILSNSDATTYAEWEETFVKSAEIFQRQLYDRVLNPFFESAK